MSQKRGPNARVSKAGMILLRSPINDGALNVKEGNLFMRGEDEYQEKKLPAELRKFCRKSRE